MVKEEIVKKYDQLISELVTAMTSGPETFYVKGEYLGYFVNRLVKGYALALDYNQSSFNSLLFNEAKRKSITQLTDKMLVYVNTGDPIQAAEELNYVLDKVLVETSRATANVDSTQYVLYIGGVIETVKNNLRDAKFDNPANMSARAMTLRRYSLAVGVLVNLSSKLGWNV